MHPDQQKKALSIFHRILHTQEQEEEKLQITLDELEKILKGTENIEHAILGAIGPYRIIVLTKNSKVFKDHNDHCTLEIFKIKLLHYE